MASCAMVALKFVSRKHSKSFVKNNDKMISQIHEEEKFMTLISYLIRNRIFAHLVNHDLPAKLIKKFIRLFIVHAVHLFRLDWFLFFNKLLTSKPDYCVVQFLILKIRAANLRCTPKTNVNIFWLENTMYAENNGNNL